MSTQKLPIVPALLREMPRMNATATPIPTAAETKLWKANCVICER
jgi:hypothetical protein